MNSIIYILRYNQIHYSTYELPEGPVLCINEKFAFDFFPDKVTIDENYGLEITSFTLKNYLVKFFK